MQRVAVVGAGLSGLMCTRSLLDAGLEVEVFEKSRGPGGRTATRRADPPLHFDHGAQYFTIRDPGIVPWLTDWLERGIVAEWTGRIVEIDGKVVRPKTDQPTRYVGVPGMAAMARDLARGLPIQLETKIVRIEPSSPAWVLTDDQGRQHAAFDHVVVTLPAPQAEELLGQRFPVADIGPVPMTPCWAVMLAFESMVPVPWDGAFVHGSPLAWVARNSSKPGRDPSVDCWVLHASAEWSASHRELTREAISELLHGEFASLAGVALPEAIHRDAHRWLYSATSSSLDRVSWIDPKSGLVLCGDWLAGGRVEGALRSGLSAAGHILHRAGIPLPSREVERPGTSLLGGARS